MEVLTFNTSTIVCIKRVFGVIVIDTLFTAALRITLTFHTSITAVRDFSCSGRSGRQFNRGYNSFITICQGRNGRGDMEGHLHVTKLRPQGKKEQKHNMRTHKIQAST